MPWGKKNASHFQGEVIRKQKIWVNGGHQWVRRSELNRFKKRSRDAVRKRKLCGEEVRRVSGLWSCHGFWWGLFLDNSVLFLHNSHLFFYNLGCLDEIIVLSNQANLITSLGYKMEHGTWGKQNCSETNTDFACKLTGKTFPLPQPLARIPITENSIDSRTCSRLSI